MKPLKCSLGKYKYRVIAPPGFEGAQARKPHYFETRADADGFCAVLERWKLAKRGKLDEVNVTEADKQWLGFLKLELGALSILPEVVRHYKKTALGLNNKCTVLELCEQWFAFQESKRLNVRTLNSDIRPKLKRFTAAYGHAGVHEITAPEMRSYLLTLPDGWTRKGYFKWLRTMFEFAREQRMTSENPFSAIKAPPRTLGEPGIYTPEDFRKLLETAWEDFPELLGWLVLSGFNFMRTAEIVPAYAGDESIRWRDFLLDRSDTLIHVRPEVAKQTKRVSGNNRYIPLTNSALHWLRPLLLRGMDIGAPVMPYATERQFGIAKAKLFREAGVEPVNNGLRHSCISYYIAANPKTGVAETAAYAGNSEAVSRQHYIKSLTPDHGKAWWSIRRKCQ